MAVIIGASTTVDFGNNACVISANWAYNPNIQRLYCIGEWTPRYNIDKPTVTLSLTVYQETGAGSYDVTPSNDCEAAGNVTASVDPTACGDAIDRISGPWFLVSYSYSRDDGSTLGTESYSLQKWVAGDSGEAPSYYVKTITEAQSTTLNSTCGITFDGSTLEGYTGSVSANSIGRHDVMYYGVASAVGGASLPVGETGSSSASCPVTALYV